MSDYIKYEFFIQRYPDSESTSYPVINIETFFNAHYKAMTKNGQTAVKNFYEEDFAEKSGSKIWLPDKTEDLAFSASELTLELLFKSNANYEVLEDEKKFLDYITGKKFEYHDTFRPNRYWQLTLVAEPETKGEILYGGNQYRWVAYKFKNWGGKYYTTSQIK